MTDQPKPLCPHCLQPLPDLCESCGLPLSLHATYELSRCISEPRPEP